MAQTNVSALHDLLSVLGAHPSLKKVDLSFNSFGGPEVGAVFANHTSSATWCVQRTTNIYKPFNVYKRYTYVRFQRTTFIRIREYAMYSHMEPMYVAY